MSIYEIFTTITAKPGNLGLVIGILIVIGTLIKINPLKIDPIGHFSNWLVSTITKDLSEKIDGMNDKIDENNKRVQRQIDSIESKIDKIDYAIDENKAVEARTRILRFGDEVSHGKNHSRDHFQQVLFDITNYNNYCLNHKEFKNDMTKMTAERIKEDYMTRERNNNFLE